MRPANWSKLGAVTAVAAVVFLVGTLPDLRAGDEPAQIPAKDFRSQTAWPVIRVVSGDTVIVKIDQTSRRIALIGIQAPPLSKPFGKEAQQFLDNLLKGEAVYVESPPGPEQEDSFGRLPAYLYRAPDGLPVNLELVRQGFADVLGGTEFEQRALFEHYAKRAKECGKGRWGKAAPTSEPSATQESAGGREEKRSDGSADGRDGKRPDGSPDDVTVYVTPSGKKYHLADCVHIRKNAKALSLKDAKARGYTPCSQCKPPE